MRELEIYLMTFERDDRGREYFAASFYEPDSQQEDLLKMGHFEKKSYYLPEGVELVEKHFEYGFTEYSLVKEIEVAGEKQRRSGSLEYDGKRVYIAWGGHKVQLTEVGEGA